MCKLQFLQNNDVGGGCRWSMLDRNLMNHAFPLLCLVLADIDGFAFMATNVDRQKYRNINNLLYPVQI